MTDLDPYAVLDVPRTASREEIARAYRTLAKRHHPDAGAPPSPVMGRINDAWRTLSDPARRARWDREHAVVVPPHWAARPEAPRRPRPRPVEPETRDSGWLAVAVVGAVAALVAGMMIVIGLAASGQSEEAVGEAFSGDEISFRHPSDWTVAAGTDDGAAHRILAHVVTYGVPADEMCTRFDDPCGLTAGTIPAGEASIIVTAWATGTPPILDPVTRRPYGLDAQRMIAGAPAAFRLRRSGDDATAWWQLSPPGFPDRWIEVQAEIGGKHIEQNEMLAQIEGVLQTVEFGP